MISNTAKSMRIFAAIFLWSSACFAQIDTDGDGMSDAWEQHYGLDPNDPNDHSADPDDDGWGNYWEYLASTNPTDATSQPYGSLFVDMNGDGIHDAYDADADGDVRNNTVGQINTAAVEDAFLDSDRDKMPDSYERRHGLDPNNRADARGDLDGDGVTNIKEFRAGSDPTDPNSVPRRRNR